MNRVILEGCSEIIFGTIFEIRTHTTISPLHVNKFITASVASSLLKFAEIH